MSNKIGIPDDEPEEQDILTRLIQTFGAEKGQELLKIGLNVPDYKRLNWYDDIILAQVTKSLEPYKAHMLYKSTPVGMEEFISSPFYMDKAGEVYPKLLSELIEINSGKYVECILTGGIGCHPAETEFLTPTGWKAISAYSTGDTVAQYDLATGASSFVTPSAYIDLPSDGWYEWRNKRSFEMKVSPEHRVLWSTQYQSKRSITKAEDLATYHNGLKNGVSGSIPATFIGGSTGVSLLDDELRLMVAFLADGNIHPHVKKNGIFAGKRKGRITIRKSRKCLRLECLLKSCNIPYTKSSSKNRPNEFTYWFYPPIETKSYSFLWESSQDQLKLIVSELKHWDGLFSDEELRFHTSDKSAADFVQYAWVATGHKAYLGVRSSESRNGRKELYIVQAVNVLGEEHSLKDTLCTHHNPEYNERKYCFTVPTGFFIIRYKNKVIISGNSGKTTGALYTLAYQTYLLSMMKDPHAAFGLDKASEILIIFQSLNANLAKALDYGRFKAMIDGSPYFKRHFPYDKDITSCLNFPNRISVKPISGLETAAIGQNVIMGLLDELNYMSITERSKHSVDGGTFDQATALYNSIARRRKSRFAQAGSLPGILCLVSSKRYPGQFTDLKEDEARREIAKYGKTTIYIFDKRVWDVKPDGSFCGVFFDVFIGDEGRKPKILLDTDFVDPADRHLVDNIPTEFREDFEKDITNALREIAGKSTLARHPFILNTEAITKCMDRNNSIFSLDSVDFVSDSLAIYPDNFKDKHLPRYAHIDLGITGDSAGLCIGTVTGFEKVVRGNGELGEVLPKYHIDGVLEIRPPKGGEILFWKIRNILYVLREQGLNIRWVSLDTFQSKDTMQILKQQGFATGTLSTDTSMLPYEVAKNALYDTRVSMPFHNKLRKELASLELDAKKGKVDHPSSANSSKDCSDAMASTIFGLLSRREIWGHFGIPPSEIPESVRKVPDKLESS